MRKPLARVSSEQANMRVTFFADAVMLWPDSDEPVVDPQILAMLNGTENADPVALADFLDFNLLDIGIVGGRVRFLYDSQGTGPQITVDYGASRELTPEELASLGDYTVGQLEDGLEEGGFSITLDGTRLRVEFAGGELRAEQREGGQPVAPALRLPKAAREGNADDLREAIAAGENINSVQAGFPALHLALLYAHRDAAILLIERGADINAVNMMGENAFAVAVASRELTDEATLEIGKTLLAKGSRVINREYLLDVAQAHGKQATRNLILASESK